MYGIKSKNQKVVVHQRRQVAHRWHPCAGVGHLIPDCCLTVQHIRFLAPRNSFKVSNNYHWERRWQNTDPWFAGSESLKKQGDLLCTVSSQHKLCLVCWGRFDTNVLVWQSQMQIRFVLLKWPVSHRLLQWPWHPSISSSVERAGSALSVCTQQEAQVGFVRKKPTQNERISLHLDLITSTEMCELHLNLFFPLM